MTAITQILKSFADIIFGLLELNFNFINDMIEMVIALVKLPGILLNVLQWTTSIGVSGYVYMIITFAVLYKMLGREG